MLLRLLTLIILICPALQSYAFTISGKITGNGAPLAGAEVILQRADSSKLAKADITDSDGGFSLTGITTSKYIIKISAAGYTGYTSEVLNITADVTLPEIKLTPKITDLKEVTISAQKPLIEIKNDKLIVNVENSIVNTGSSVFEVLGRSPGVMIDQSDNINLKGKPGVTIMMNGKIMPMQGSDLANLLKSMPSSSIEKIEIIANPGARYDAAGSGGIINIIAKKDKRRGINGSANASYGQGIYSRATGGFNLNYGGKKLLLNAGYNYADRKSLNDLNITREFYSKEVLMTRYTQFNHLFFPTKNHSGSVALDYNLSSKTTFGASVIGHRSRFNPLGENTSRVDSALTPTYFTTTNHSDDAWDNYSINGYLKHTFDTTGRMLSADIDYARFWNQTYQLYTTHYYDKDYNPSIPNYILYGDLSGLTQIRSAKVDYVHPLKNGINLEAGIKSSYVTADNEPLFYDRSSGADIQDTSKSNHFIYTENINAAYINASRDMPKWSYQLGLRGEQTIATGNQVTTGQQFTRQYVQLFPSLAVQRHINTNNDLGITLSRRIDRPAYKQLNPFKYFLDPTNYRTGNPYLNPTLAYSAEISHTYKQRFITTFTASITHDIITETLEADAIYPNISKQTDKNITSMYFYGISIAYPFTITKWWSATVNSNVYYSLYDGNLSNTTLHKGRPVFDVYASNSFTLGKGFSAEVSGN